MLTETLLAREKLTLFWSGHFMTEFTYDLGYIPPKVLYRQNLMLRRMRLANFRAFLEEVTLDCAMLEYLGGTLNVAGKPNENDGALLDRDRVVHRRGCKGSCACADRLESFALQ